MKKLIEVDQARALMTEAIDWSVMKWLSEKKRVRRAADKANAVLDSVEKQAQGAWSEELKAAYSNSGVAAPETRQLAKKLKEAHDAAINLRMEAEETFDKAERRLSTALARDGCHQAIKGWELHLEAIRRAEAAIGGRRF
jgi:hypothetical protein